MIRRIERAVASVEHVLDRLVAIMMLAIMGIVVLSVIMRYVFHSPLIWAYDAIGLYLMPAVFFFALSGTYAANKHISLDIVVKRFGTTVKRWVEILTCLLSIPLFLLIAKGGAERAYMDWLNGNVMAGLIAWPTWLSYVLVPLGAALLLIRLTVRLIGHAVSLLKSRDLIDVIPIIGHEKD